MIKSRRARRMERNHQKAKTPSLNLVALMDIFTLLVFFLLVNSASTQHVPNQKIMKLPVSNSKIIPEDTLVVEITRSHILLQGAVVASLTEVLNSSEETIPALYKALTAFNNGQDLAANGQEKYKITIMGDENISYDVIRKVLSSCQQTKYTNIAFAAMQKPRPNS